MICPYKSNTGLPESLRKRGREQEPCLEKRYERGQQHQRPNGRGLEQAFGSSESGFDSDPVPVPVPVPAPAPVPVTVTVPVFFPVSDPACQADMQFETEREAERRQEQDVKRQYETCTEPIPENGATSLCLESASMRTLFCDLPTDFLPLSELDALVSKRPDAPSFLRCAACLILPHDAMWLSCCDVVACKACLATPDDEHDADTSPWCCPRCGTALGCGEQTEDFHGGAYVVTAIRTIVHAWKRITMEAIDPYSHAAM